MPPVCGSSVAASKSATPSNRPPLRMNSLSALRLAFLGRAMIGVGAAERRRQGSADDPDIGRFGASAADDILHAGLHRFDRGIAVLAEIVDAFEPDQSGDAG